jgi:hypothetical protein
MPFKSSIANDCRVLNISFDPSAQVMFWVSLRKCDAQRPENVLDCRDGCKEVLYNHPGINKTVLLEKYFKLRR